MPEKISLWFSRERETRAEYIAKFISPAVTYVILLRIWRKSLPQRAKYVILLGHAQETEHDIYQRLICIRDRSAKKYVIFLT